MSIDQYIHEINRLFERHGLDLRVTDSDLLFSDQMVTDAYSEDRPISAKLTAMISPPIHRGEFYHYTRGDVATKILESGIMRLTTVRKRIGEDELREFLREFGFDHPLGIDPGSAAPRYETSIASEVFYTSFTDISLSEFEEKHFWDHFAGPTGARLKFRLSLGTGCLRRMAYGDQIDRCAKLFRELSDFTRQSLGKVFFWDDAATACALYLPRTYDIEKETRLIVRRRWSLPSGIDGDYEYLEARIGDNLAIPLKIELIEIQTNQPVLNPRGANVIPRTKKASAL